MRYILRRQWHPTAALLPGKSHGRRSLVGCSPWGGCKWDTTGWLHFHFSLSCVGEGNGNPLQCSCLENPRDGGAWWAAVYGVAQSRTRLKRLSHSSIRLGLPWRLSGNILGRGFAGASACAGDAGSISGSGRAPGGGNGNPLQYSCLENPMDRRTWRTTVRGVTKSQTGLSN